MSRTPLVLVHGNPESAVIWGPLIGELNRADAVTLSPPGFGVPAPRGFFLPEARRNAEKPNKNGRTKMPDSRCTSCSFSPFPFSLFLSFFFFYLPSILLPCLFFCPIFSSCAMLCHSWASSHPNVSVRAYFPFSRFLHPLAAFPPRTPKGQHL